MKNWPVFFYRHRIAVVAALVAVTILLGTRIRMPMDNSIKTWFTPDDPAYLTYKRVCDTFDGGRFLIIAIEGDDLFSPGVLGWLKRTTIAIEGAPDVRKVSSLANSNKLTASEEGIENRPLLANFANDGSMVGLNGAAEIESIRRLALEDEFFRNYLVSPDGRFLSLIVSFEDMNVVRTDTAYGEVMKIAGAGLPAGVKMHVSGDIRLMVRYNDFTRENQGFFPALIMGMILVFSAFIFKSASRVAVVGTVIGISLVLTLGLYSWIGFTFNVVTGMMVPLVIILTIADCIHIIEYRDEMCGFGGSSESVFVSTLEYVTLPCLLTSLTTAIGLYSLKVSPIDAVRNFGVGAAAGVMFAFVVSIVLVPVMMDFLSGNAKSGEAGEGREESADPGGSRVSALWDGLLLWLGGFVVSRYRLIIAVSIAILAVFTWGITMVRVETNQIEWFPRSDPFYTASQTLNTKFMGFGSIEIIVEGPENSIREPDVLKKMVLFESSLGQIAQKDRIRKIISLATYVREIHKVLSADQAEQTEQTEQDSGGSSKNDADDFGIPGSANMVSQELLLFTMSRDGLEELDQVVTRDFAIGRILVKIESGTSRSTVELAETVEKLALCIFGPAGLKVTLTGTSYMYALIYKYLLSSQVQSFATAFALVMALMFLIYRSLSYGLMSATANLLPIILIVGLMGWAGITINVGTVMVASVALGIAIDDTIHFLSRFRKELRGGASCKGVRETTVTTIRKAGKAMIFTSLVNIAGFAVLMMADFQPTREFGLLVAITLAFALAGDLVLLPATAVAFENRIAPRSPDPQDGRLPS